MHALGGGKKNWATVALGPLSHYYDVTVLMQCQNIQKKARKCGIMP
jgi:hypothetical protein